MLAFQALRLHTKWSGSVKCRGIILLKREVQLATECHVCRTHMFLLNNSCRKTWSAHCLWPIVNYIFFFTMVIYIEQGNSIMLYFFMKTIFLRWGVESIGEKMIQSYTIFLIQLGHITAVDMWDGGSEAERPQLSWGSLMDTLLKYNLNQRLSISWATTPTTSFYTKILIQS